MSTKKKKHNKHAIVFPDDGLTQQHFKKECDINRIVKRFTDTGVVEHVARHPGRYANVPAQSFTDAMFLVASMRSEFEGLPSKIRSHFDNDVAKFLEATQDPDRQSELVEIGLYEPQPEAAPLGPSQDVSETSQTTSEPEKSAESDIT